MSTLELLTNAELFRMFGTHMPLEAARVIFDSPAWRGVGDVRLELKRIAAQQKPRTGRPFLDELKTSLENMDLVDEAAATDAQETIVHMFISLLDANEILRKAVMDLEDANAKLAARKVDADGHPIATGRAVTHADLAEAFDCVHNAAIGTAHERQEGMTTAIMLAAAFGCMAQRLRELDE